MAYQYKHTMGTNFVFFPCLGPVYLWDQELEPLEMQLRAR